MSTTGSVVVRRSLGRRLKKLREDAGKRAADVEEAQIAGRTKLYRIEHSTDPVRIPDVQSLCLLYGTDAATRDQLVEMARNSSGPGWWEDYGDAMPSWFGMYVEFESAATELLTWDPELIHGLLQTPDYHRAVIQADPDPTAEYTDRQLRLRAERQHTVLHRADPLQITAVIGEGALLRQVGGLATITDQREHLTKLSTQDHIEVRVLPWSAGSHQAMKGAFSILGFEGQDDPDVVYLETHAGGRYVEQAAMVADYRRLFDAIRGASIPIEEYRP